LPESFIALDPQRIEHGYSAWHKLLAGIPAGRDVYATVDLRDGTTIAGWVFVCTVEPFPAEQRELVLAKARGDAIKIRRPDSTELLESPDRLLILNGADVLAIGATHYAKPEATAR
jgi:hypothetical protein